MLKIKTEYIDDVYAAQHPEDLFTLIQQSIELEHSTIPPYLTAMISLKPQRNRQVWELIHSVVIEEMLHMCIVANVLNALGGSPNINKPDFIPSYPTPLPMDISSGLIVGLEKFSKPLIKNAFMEIELPETPFLFQNNNISVISDAIPEFATIGEFYRALQMKLSELSFDTMPGDSERQVTNEKMYSRDLLFPILTVTDAINALDIIVRQGEGTDTSPLSITSGNYAHYYRFQELFVGRRLVYDQSTADGYSFSGDIVPFNETDVYPIVANTRVSDLPDNSQQKHSAAIFNCTYGKLLDGLHQTFNGEPEQLESLFGLMYDIKLQGEKLAAMEYPGRPGENVGPPFEYNHDLGVFSY